MLSSVTFIVFHFTFKSVIHFELLLRNVWRLDQWLIFQPVDTQLFQHHLLKPVHPPLNWICNFVKNQLAVLVWDYFWVLYSIPLISVFILPPIPTILLTVYKQSENWVGWFLSILLFFKIVFLVPLHFHINFWLIFPESIKVLLEFDKKVFVNCGK